LASGTLEEVHDVEFDETNGFQEEDKNLDDVRGTQLANTMKKMDVGDIRPREVIEFEDDNDQVLSNAKMQATDSHYQNQASSSSQVQHQQVAIRGCYKHTKLSRSTSLSEYRVSNLYFFSQEGGRLEFI
jgi:hypothetical protein